MSTFSDLIYDAAAILRGYVMEQDQSTHLTAAVDDNDLSWSVSDVSRLSPGRCEVGNELVYIDSFDASNNLIQLAPYGRGMDGSTPAAHVILSQVINNPRFPRHRVKRAINDTLASVSGALFATGVEQFTTSQSAISYELPVTAQSVLSVRIETSTDIWIELRDWFYDPAASTSTHSTGKAIVTGRLTGARVLEVTYTVDPTELDADGDVFTTVTGLPESCRDVIVFGACWRVLSAVGPGKLTNAAIAAGDMDSRSGGNTQAEQAESMQMYRMFSQRLQEERLKLLQRHPAPTHNTRF